MICKRAVLAGATDRTEQRMLPDSMVGARRQQMAEQSTVSEGQHREIDQGRIRRADLKGPRKGLNDLPDIACVHITVRADHSYAFLALKRYFVRTEIHDTPTARSPFLSVPGAGCRTRTRATTSVRARGWALWKPVLILSECLDTNPKKAADTHRVIDAVLSDHRQAGT
ncbi:hypothetical protein ABZ930_36765 [Streptomyces sp. NPDC046716]|uniref:hypothetical protein n=1 Tax=Streptomyces sp. NPDC046716 TaxID=3157093 RepID=UPI0033D5F415